MICFRPFTLVAAFTIACTFAIPSPVRAESPLEKLHKKLLGSDDRRKGDDKKKDKDRDRQRDDDRRDDDRHDHRYDDRRSYDRRDSVIVERRVYVEPAPRPYYQTAPRPIEADVQLALRREGYYRGPIDGDLGPGSRAAIRNYQLDHRLPATGRIDNYLLRSLQL